MKIKTKSVFDFARIIKKANLKEEVKRIYSTEGSANDLGIEAIFAIFDACSTTGTEKDLYKFFGDIFGKTPEEVEEQELDKTVDELKELVKDNPNFFSTVQKLLN